MVRVGTAIPPAPPRNDLERIWPYVPGLHRSEIERDFGIRDVLKLASNENPLGPSPKALAAVERLAGEAHLYPDSQALTLRGALAAYSIIGVILSIPLIGLGFTLTAGILVTLFVLQLPLFLLFGAFRAGESAVVEIDEWDRSREEAQQNAE